MKKKSKYIFILFILFSQIIISASDFKDLKAYYSFDEIDGNIISDVVSGQWNGKSNNFVINDNESKYGQSSKFIEGGSISLPKGMYDSEKGELTMVMWIKPSEFNEADHIWNYVGDIPELLIRYDSDSDSLLATGYKEGFEFRFLSCKPSLNNWTMITYQFTSKKDGEARFWCNGEIISQDDAVNMVFNSDIHSHNLGVPDSSALPKNNFKGYIDEFGWWDRYLTDEEILRLYNNGLGVNYSFIATDSDIDTIPDYRDNCPDSINTDQFDIDEDMVGDECDNCIYFQNFEQKDLNKNGVGDICEIVKEDVLQRLDLLEQRIAALENWKSLVSLWIDSTSIQINEFISLTNEIKLKNKIQDSNITLLQESLSEGIPTNYFKYLSNSDKEKMLCGYATENRLTNYSDLGLSCSLEFRQLRNGRERVICNCE